ncbi:MBL fold metallo-hydrolase [Candidatus Peregrinibacteria bacterium]|nr:MBL fold metallo-hydrolase [Candidatus Peregrinibacteria bacterium]
MDIIWHGRACFTLKSKDGVVVTDPYSTDGFKAPKLKADVILASKGTKETEYLPVENNPQKIDWPGEYDIKGIPIAATEAWDIPKSEEDKGKPKNPVNVFVFDLEGIRICHLGNLGHKLTDEMMESLQNIDILLVPVGGKFAMDAKKAHEVIEEIEPRVVIPMLYKYHGEKLDLDTIDNFLKEEGVKTPTELEKFSIGSRSQLPQDHTEFVILKAVS